MKSKILYIVGGLLLLLMVLNPSPSDFHYFAKGKEGDVDTHRQLNLLICSIYKTSHSGMYFGIAGNYITIERGHKPYYRYKGLIK